MSPESKMVVLHDFSPCVDDELEVKRGQVKIYPKECKKYNSVATIQKILVYYINNSGYVRILRVIRTN